MNHLPDLSKHNFTIEAESLSDGCLVGGVNRVVACASSLSGSMGERDGFPRFLIEVDGKSHNKETVPALKRFLSSIAIGSKCEVFRNAGKGATIKFA